MNWWPWQKTERERELGQEIEKLKAELELEQMRSEGLAHLLEALRQQMLANVAVSTRLAMMYEPQQQQNGAQRQ